MYLPNNPLALMLSALAVLYLLAAPRPTDPDAATPAASSDTVVPAPADLPCTLPNAHAEAAKLARPPLTAPMDTSPRMVRRADNTYACRAHPGAEWGPCVFKAQDGEDYEYLRRFSEPFPQGARNLIVEAGAWDGIGFSTSWFFEHHLGWRALHFEPSPRNFPNLQRNRPGAANVERALCAPDFEQRLTWIDQNWDSPSGGAAGGAVGGIEALMAPGFHAHFHTEAEFAAGRSVRTNVTCGPLWCYLRRLGVTEVALFVLDVEGAELEALRAFHWDEVRVQTWIIEADSHAPGKNNAVRDMMRAHGYRLEIIGRNDWFFLETTVKTG